MPAHAVGVIDLLQQIPDFLSIFVDYQRKLAEFIVAFNDDFSGKVPISKQLDFLVQKAKTLFQITNDYQQENGCNNDRTDDIQNDTQIILVKPVLEVVTGHIGLNQKILAV